MFKCQGCSKTSQPCEKQFKNIVEKRIKTYGEGRVGWEIVKEINVCEGCVGSSIVVTF